MPESKEPSNSIKAAKTYFSIINDDIPNWDLEISESDYDCYVERTFPAIYGDSPILCGESKVGQDENPVYSEYESGNEIRKLMKAPKVATLIDEDTKARIEIRITPKGYPERSIASNSNPIIHPGIVLLATVETEKKIKGFPTQMLLAHYGIRVDNPRMSADELLLKLAKVLYENAKNVDVALKGLNNS